MNASLAFGLVAALGSALALNWGYWAQHGAASELPRLSLGQPLHSLRLLFADRRWAAGFFAGIGGWVLYVLALRVAPLSLVQSVAAGGVGVLALLAWRIRGPGPARRELISVAVALVGLVFLAVSLGGAAPHGGRASLAGVLGWVICSLLFAAVAVGPGARIVRQGAAFGMAAGVLYAAGDVVTKAAVGGGARSGLVVLVLACHGLAFVLLQLGFQRGDVLSTAGLSSLFTNAVPIVAGITLFGEGLPAGWAGAARVVAFAAVVAGGAGLARGDSSVGEGDVAPSAATVRATSAVRVSQSG